MFDAEGMRITAKYICGRYEEIALPVGGEKADMHGIIADIEYVGKRAVLSILTGKGGINAVTDDDCAKLNIKDKIKFCYKY